MNRTPSIMSGNAGFVEALYEDFLSDPESVSAEWRQYFENLPAGAQRPDPSPPRVEVAHSVVRERLRQQARIARRPAPAATSSPEQAGKQDAVQELILEYRQRGHLRARTDPIGLHPPQQVASLTLEYHGLSEADLDREFSPGSLLEGSSARLRDIVAALERIYCGSVGAEYAYISDPEQVEWVRARLEQPGAQPQLPPGTRERLLRGLTAAEGLERYLHRKYVGQKRFSLEGGDTLIPLIDTVVNHAGRLEARELVIGMAHRGRLNVVVNILGKRPQELFSEFEGKSSANRSGDVKYHQGFSSDLMTEAGPLHVTLAFNPSHLEIINPVVEGSVRARQERRRDAAKRQVLPLLIHGDAAIAGQGVVSETLNLAKTRGYATGGTLHVVINNQIGFTTSNPLDARSTLYCTDIAKLVQAPIFHVNGDDPDAVARIARLALDFRHAFNTDVVIDLVCYRRHGHNEADEPSITQPAMYRQVVAMTPVREKYAAMLADSGDLDAQQAAQMVDDYQKALEGGAVVALNPLSDQRPLLAIDWAPYLETKWTATAQTAVPVARLRHLSERLERLPDGFELHPRVQKLRADRHKMIAGELPLDWGCAETLAYASLLTEGYRVRLSGQDSGRGTFAHRHAVLHNQNLEQGRRRYTPLKHLAENQPRFLVIDSLLSEEAVLGFEYGYSSADPHTLVIWEAQFGDFANGAQVVIDQFISSSEAKWERLSGIVMFLPHGYEGQGPEHSSARLERYLQLCAEQNMQVCVPSTPAQMFHMLRRQMLRPYRRPLVVMTPKSLLRHKASVSALEDLAHGHFHLVIGEQRELDDAAVRSVVACSGKLYYELAAARDDAGIDDVAVVRMEQLYPFPEDEFLAELGRYPNATELVWAQEEPQNQGAWYQIRHRLVRCAGARLKLRYAGRPRSAAPAGGYYSKHLAEQKTIIQKALDRPAERRAEPRQAAG